MTTRGRLAAFEVATLRDDRRFTARVIELFGHRDVSALQVAFERGHSQIEAWLHGTRNVPDDILLVLELLEHCPKQRWPKRWKRCAL